MATFLFEFPYVDGPPETPLASLERSYIIEHLAGKGYTLADLITMPAAVARQLRIEASIYASTRLAQLETRYQLLCGLRGER